MRRAYTARYPMANRLRRGRGRVSILTQPFFQNEVAALAKLDRIRWPAGPICPHCGANDRIGLVTGKGARPGLKFCNHCRKQLRSTIGTVFESSHVPLHKWFQAVLLLTGGPRRISVNRLHRVLRVTDKTARAMIRRLGPAIAITLPLARWRALTGVGDDLSPESQYLEFVKTARELGCREDTAGFDRILARIVRRSTTRPPSKVPLHRYGRTVGGVSLSNGEGSGS